MGDEQERVIPLIPIPGSAKHTVKVRIISGMVGDLNNVQRSDCREQLWVVNGGPVWLEIDATRVTGYQNVLLVCIEEGDVAQLITRRDVFDFDCQVTGNAGVGTNRKSVAMFLDETCGWSQKHDSGTLSPQLPTGFESFGAASPSKPFGLTVMNHLAGDRYGRFPVPERFNNFCQRYRIDGIFSRRFANSGAIMAGR
jgi:hypothetical protein